MKMTGAGGINNEQIIRDYMTVLPYEPMTQKN